MTRYMVAAGTANKTATGTPLPGKLFGRFLLLNNPSLQLIDFPALISARGQGLSTGRAATGNAQLAGGFCGFRWRGKGARGNVSPGAPELQFLMDYFLDYFISPVFAKNDRLPRSTRKNRVDYFPENNPVLTLNNTCFCVQRPACGFCAGAPLVIVNAPASGRW